MKKPLLTLIVSLGLLALSYGQSLPTNVGGTITITNMGAFNGTYNYLFNGLAGTIAVDLGYPLNSTTSVYRTTNDKTIIFNWQGDSHNILRIHVRNSGVTNHQIAFNSDRSISTNPSYLIGEGLNVLNGTLPDFMLTWSGGGAGPGYTKMVNARAKAQELAENLTFQNGRWSPH